MYDNSEIFWLTGNCTYYVNEDYIDVVQEYRYTETEANKITNKLENKIDDIISEMPDYNTDFEKELYLHDYVCDNTVYDESTMETTGHTAHSSLLDGKTVCEGYARAVQMFAAMWPDFGKASTSEGYLRIKCIAQTLPNGNTLKTLVFID